MNFLNIGGKLGKRFVIGKRDVVACMVAVLSITSYHFNLQLHGNCSGNRNKEVEAILAALNINTPCLTASQQRQRSARAGSPILDL
jgi:hypothetical protein